jgi:hypothetical protein
MKKLWMILLVSLASCGVDQVASTEAADEPVASQQGEVGDDSAASHQEVTCFTEWDCQVCSNTHKTQNVLVETCSDGSETVVSARACGEACF